MEMEFRETGYEIVIRVGFSSGILWNLYRLNIGINVALYFYQAQMSCVYDTAWTIYRKEPPLPLTLSFCLLPRLRSHLASDNEESCIPN